MIRTHSYTAWDTAALILLTHTPPLTLLTTFYTIRPTTTFAALCIDILSFYLPLRLLRPLSPTHTSSPPRGSISNKPVLTDLPTTLSTSFLATCIYALALYTSYTSFLPTFLIAHFTNIRSIAAAHLGAPGLPTLLLSLIPAGFCAREFLFVSSTSSSRTSTPERVFDPATATLPETIYYNLWGWYTPREKVLFARMAALVLMTTSNTLVQLLGTIEGIEMEGAAGWAGIWVTATMVVTFSYWRVGDVDGI
jgi:hypothetical protein